MAFNGSGLFNIDSTGQPVSANTLIESADFNALTADLATGLSNCITKDGQQTITANLPMATYRHTGVGNAVARTDYAAAGQVQDGKLNWVDGGGTADAITATYSPAITALVDGQLCCVRATAANATTTPTFAPNGLTARTIVKKGGAALVAGDIVADGHELILRYDLANTRWELLNPGSYSSLAANTFTGLQTWSAGANIASAATLDLTAATGNIVRITGTTATSAVTLNNGQYVICYAVGAWPLTNHATNHPLPGGADYTCAAGDLVIYSKNGSAEISVQIVPKSGQSVVSSAAMPRSYLAGFGLSNNGTDPTNDIDIAVGACRDSTNAADIVLASSLTKQLDAAWAVGTNAGGLDTGTIANGTYHVWAIKRSDTGVVDALFSTSASAPTMPTNYTHKRRIGSIMRSGGAIVAFTQDGDYFGRNATVLDVNASNPGTSAVLRTLSIPSGIILTAICMVEAQETAAIGPAAVYISDPNVSDESPSTGGFSDITPAANVASRSQNGASRIHCKTNTSAQVRSRVSNSAASTTLFMRTLGWIDTRGRDA